MAELKLCIFGLPLKCSNFYVVGYLQSDFGSDGAAELFRLPPGPDGVLQAKVEAPLNSDVRIIFHNAGLAHHTEVVKADRRGIFVLYRPVTDRAYNGPHHESYNFPPDDESRRAFENAVRLARYKNWAVEIASHSFKVAGLIGGMIFSGTEVAIILFIVGVIADQFLRPYLSGDKSAFPKK